MASYSGSRRSTFADNCDSTTKRLRFEPGDESGRDPEQDTEQDEPNTEKQRIFRYETDFHISNFAWSNRQEDSFELALCSLEATGEPNCLEIVKLNSDEAGEEVEVTASIAHHYPATKVLWMPNPENFGFAPFESQYSGPADSLLATSADHMRFWRVERRYRINLDAEPWMFRDQDELDEARRPKLVTELRLEQVLNQYAGRDHDSPLTSFDWNDVDPKLLATTSYDGHCSLWDIEYGKITVSVHDPFRMGSYDLRSLRKNHQLIVERRPAFDVSFSRYGSGRDLFVTVGGDCTASLYDTRDLDKVSLYRSSDTERGSKPIVRVSCSKQSDNLVAFLEIGSQEILLMDMRCTNRLLCTLDEHLADVSSIAWAPHSANHLVSSSMDQRAMIWNLDTETGSYEEPLLAYNSLGAINYTAWSAAHPDWIAIAYDNQLELLRV